MNKENIKYVTISPVRDEEKYLEATLESVINQTVKPIEWVIVDDGSTDNTGEIIDGYAKKYPWIRVIHRQNRGFRKAGGGVVEAFHEGYNFLQARDWDFLVKLDGDLSFAPDYFKKCFDHFAVEPSLGIGGGDIYHDIDGKLILEKNPAFHVRGATKIYRRECWNAIGKLIEAPGWDTLDEVKANMLGWETRSFSDLQIVHHRYTGATDGTWCGWVKNGRANYISGYHPLFMVLKCLRRAFRRPVLIGALGLLYGFVSGYFKGIPQVEDRALINYLRRQQINRILMKESIWK
jgi:glycosyltransferase involved in cell wall biosynthesis